MEEKDMKTRDEDSRGKQKVASGNEKINVG
jgi:hypothetical protein